MARLKRETQALHEATEARMPVMDPALDRAAYAQLLAQLYALIAPLEARLLTLDLPAGLALPERLKTPALRRDLSALGMAAPQEVPDGLPATAAEGLGSLYVLEGGTLGGQIISRHLGPRLNLGTDTGLAYFSGYGPQTGPMWRRFGEAMAQAVPPEHEAEVVRGAAQTFRAFGRALDRGQAAQAGGEARAASQASSPSGVSGRANR